MAEITNELMYELMKRMHSDIQGLRSGQNELKSELISVRGTMVSMQQDIHNIYGVLYQHDQRLDRIERRLDVREMAEAGIPFEYQG